LNTRATAAIQEQDLELNSIASFSVNWKEALKIRLCLLPNLTSERAVTKIQK
jgi:hypothetical protein